MNSYKSKGSNIYADGERLIISIPGCDGEKLTYNLSKMTIGSIDFNQSSDAFTKVELLLYADKLTITNSLVEEEDFKFKLIKYFKESNYYKNLSGRKLLK